MGKPFPSTQRETHSLHFLLIKERRHKCNQTRRQRVGVRILSEEHLAGKWLREQSDEQHSDMYLMSRGQDLG